MESDLIGRAGVWPDRPRILIAEDDPHLRGLLSLLIRRLGDIDYTAVADGAAALELLATKRFDVLILDLMMPRVNGYDVIDALARMTGHRPAVIVVSAAVNTTMLNADVVTFVVRKPFDIELLAAILDDMARRMAQRPDAHAAADVIPFELPSGLLQPSRSDA